MKISWGWKTKTGVQANRHREFEQPRSWKTKRHTEVSLTVFALPIRHLPIPYWAVAEAKKLSKKQLTRREFLAVSQHWVNKIWNSGLPRHKGPSKHSSLSFSWNPWQAALYKLEVTSRPRLKGTAKQCWVISFPD